MKQKLIGTQIVVMVIIILGKFVGFIRESVLASKFGTSYEMDVYSYSMTVLLFLATIGYSITTTVIPIFTKNKIKSKGEQEELANNLITIMFFLGLIFNIITVIFSESIVKLLAPGFDDKALIIAKNLIIIMNFSLISIFIQSVISGILQAYNRFYTSAAMAGVGNIVTIIYLMFFVDKYGIYGFGVSTLIAYLLQLIINIPSYRQIGFKYKFILDFKDSQIINIFKLTIPILVSTCIIQLFSMITTFYGSLIGEGAISTFNYSNRLINLTVEIFAIGMSMVIYPVLSKVDIKEDSESFNNILKKGILIMCFVIIPIFILMAVLNKEIVSFLYERNEFTRENTILTSQVLLILSPIIIFSSIRDLLNKASYSLGEAKISMKISTYMIMLAVLGNFLSYRKLGVYGLGLITTFVNAIGTIYTFIFLKKKFDFIRISIRTHIIRIFISSTIMGIIVFVIKEMNFRIIIYSKLFELLFLGLLGVIVYILFITLLFINDIINYKKNGVKLK